VVAAPDHHHSKDQISEFAEMNAQVFRSTNEGHRKIDIRHPLTQGHVAQLARGMASVQEEGYEDVCGLVEGVCEVEAEVCEVEAGACEAEGNEAEGVGLRVATGLGSEQQTTAGHAWSEVLVERQQ